MNLTPKLKSIFIGLAISIIVAGIIIFAVETNKSFLQIFITAGIFIIPFMFLSSINGKFVVFIFALPVLLGGYLCYKMEWYDTIYGLIMAGTLGGAIHYFRISKTKTFGAEDYKDVQKNKHEENFSSTDYKAQQAIIKDEYSNAPNKVDENNSDEIDTFGAVEEKPYVAQDSFDPKKFKEEQRKKRE